MLNIPMCHGYPRELPTNTPGRAQNCQSGAAQRAQLTAGPDSYKANTGHFKKEREKKTKNT